MPAARGRPRRRGAASSGAESRGRLGVRDVAAVHVGVAAAEPPAERVHHRRAARGRAAHLHLDGVRAGVVGVEHHPLVGAPDRPVRPGSALLCASEVIRIAELQRAGGREPRAGVVGGGVAARQAAHPDGADARAVDALQAPLHAGIRDAARSASGTRRAGGRRRGGSPSSRAPCRSRTRRSSASGRRAAARSRRSRTCRRARGGASSRAGSAPSPDTNTPTSVVAAGARPSMRPSDASYGAGKADRDDGHRGAV